MHYAKQMQINQLTHLPLVAHTYMRQWIAPIRGQAGIWTNAGLLSIGPLGTNFSEILIKIQNFSFMKMHLKISSVKWRPFCPRGDELMRVKLTTAEMWSPPDIAPTVHPKNYTVYTLWWSSLFTNSHISIRFTSQALGQSHDCPSGCEATLNTMGKQVKWNKNCNYNTNWCYI